MNSEVRKDLIEVTRPFVEARPHGDTLESKQLFDPEYWTSLDMYTQRWLGTLVATLVREGALPLRRRDHFTSDRHNLYERI